MIGEEFFEEIEKPENWPANAKECELENIYMSLKNFIKDYIKGRYRKRISK